MKKLNIIGVGMGNIDYLINQARKIILQSDIILTTDRIKENLNIINENIYTMSLTNMKEFIEKNDKDISVLVSGDCGFYSLSKNIVKDFQGKRNINIINGLSSMQYFASKLNMSYENWVNLSMHGRFNFSAIGTVSYNEYTFILTGGVNKAEIICKELMEFGLGDKIAFAGEFLSYENERIIKGTVSELSNMKFKDLTVLLIHNEKAVNNYTPINDIDFIRNDVPMTKEAVRWVSINKLYINPNDIIFDIGSGTGSVSIEMARKCFKGIVISIEKKEEAFNLLKKNINKFGAFNVKAINAIAPIKDKLPVPNRVFIGGSGGNMKDIIKWIVSISSDFKIVINCITLETLSESISILNENNFNNVEVSCVNVSQSKKRGNYNMMVASNPVYIINGEFNGSKC